MNYSSTFCYRFDVENGAGGRRPSSTPSGRSRDAVASDLFTDSIFGSDGGDWLDMASGSGNKSSNQAKSTSSDRPRSEGSITDTGKIMKLGIKLPLYFVLQCRIFKTGCDVVGMCCKKKTNWAKKCLEYEVESARTRGRPK